ncbi:MAG: efflux RND transporter permease subunit [Burkholderiaceae bacterium]
MRLSHTCIQRPVFATVLAIILMLVGAVSFERLQVREYPQIDEPVVTVRTEYLGASAEIIESQVSKPLEDSIAGIEGVDVLTSISRAELSQITVRFRLERDPDGAAADVRDRVARARSKLPDDVIEPVVAKVEADANPVVWMSFSSENMSALEVSDIANRIVKPRLQTLPGAADVRIFGERKYAMRIWLDKNQLGAFGLTPLDVEQALRSQNIEVPAGRIESAMREFNVVSSTDLRTVADFESMVLKTELGYPVRLRDVARVEIGAENDRTVVRFNGRNTVAMGIIKQATANPLILSAALREQIPNIERDLPDGLKITISHDSSLFIERSIEAVFMTIGEAAALVAIVIFLFLGTVRASIIPLVTIPIALVTTFALMLVAGFSINTLTLLALVLAIGLVVDDAIVVLENVHRHIENGMKPVAAAHKGISEVAFAVIAMTLTLAAVYAPQAFTPGRTGRLLIEFSLTLAGAVLVSGFIALTLTPMMCARLLRHEENPGLLSRVIEATLRRLVSAYRKALVAVLALRWLVLAGVVGCFVATTLLWTSMKAELAPTEDRGVMLVNFTAPEGSSIQYTSEYAERIERIAMSVPEVDRVFMVAGNPTVERGTGSLRMADWNDRDRKVPEMLEELLPQLLTIPGVRANGLAPPSLGQPFRSRPFHMMVITSDTYEKLQDGAEPLLADLRAWPGLQGVETDLRLDKPELRLWIDRDRAADAGVSMENIGRVLETSLGGRRVTRFRKDGEQFEVIVQLDPAGRSSPDDISDILVAGNGGRLLPLSSLLRAEETVGPKELNHFSQRRALAITANLGPGTSQGEALAYAAAAADRLLPQGFVVDWDGQSREFFQSSSSQMLTLVLALLFIYLVLAAQFESFVDPLIIISTVPLSMVGGLLLLEAGGGTINVYSKIGLITLIGLITKHGILIVEFANQLRDRGSSIREAVIEAACLRLRPILMTTGAMVLGAVPLAFATGAGAESRQQIGLVVVGGMSLGTVLTLFVVPSVYMLFTRRHREPIVDHREALESAA